MPGLMAPDSFPIRKPTDASMTNGKNANPPRYMEVGGMKGPGVWNKDTGDPQSPSANIAKVKAPVRGGKSGHSSTGRDDD